MGQNILNKLKKSIEDNPIIVVSHNTLLKHIYIFITLILFFMHIAQKRYLLLDLI